MVPKLKKTASVTSQSWSQYFGEQPFTGGCAEEGQDGVFWTDLMEAEPMGYRWFRQWTWETNLTEVIWETNSYFVISNVDSWVDGYVDEDNVFHGTLAACSLPSANPPASGPRTCTMHSAESPT